MSAKDILKKESFKTITKALKTLKELGYDLSDRELRATVAKHFGSTIKYVSKKAREESSNKTFFTKKADKLIKIPFVFQKGIYTIYSSRGMIKLSLKEVDALFYEFSKHGLNLTQTQIINKYNFKPWEWYSIKNALNIYKDSDIFSPHVLENFTAEEKEQAVTKRIEAALNDKQNIEFLYNKTVIKQYKNIIKNKNEKKLFFESLELGLEEIKDTFKYKEITVAKNENAEKKEVVVFLADLHMGAKVEGLHITPDYNTSILKNKFDRVADEVNRLCAEKVNIVFLGDAIESFTGLNHKNTWQAIERNMFGAKLVKETVNVILNFLASVNNVCEVYAIGGNHDRGDSNSKVDYKGEIGAIIFNWLDTLLPYKVNFNFDVLSPFIDDIQYICMHGHNKEVSKPIEQTILNYGKQDKYNLLISGHLHTFKVIKDSHNYRQIVCPSVFTGNNYSERNGWVSNGGFILCCNNGDGKPNMSIYSI